MERNMTNSGLNTKMEPDVTEEAVLKGSKHEAVCHFCRTSTSFFLPFSSSFAHKIPTPPIANFLWMLIDFPPLSPPTLFAGIPFAVLFPGDSSGFRLCKPPHSSTIFVESVCV
ncbi:hypothetical protein SDJN02_17760, partial [Cucurbita argyrosperma subsp. argyrosperma]